MNLEERKKNYSYHHKNAKLIECSINLLQENIKDLYIEEYLVSNMSLSEDVIEIKKKQCIRNRDAYVKLLVGVVVSWSEELLKRLLYEKDGFTDEQITKVHQLKDSRQKWLTILKISFCNFFFKYKKGDSLYAKIKSPEKESKINKSVRLKYLEVKLLIEEEIFPTIDLRNKVQHGEWLYAFEAPDSLKYDKKLTGLIRKQNIRTVQTKILDIVAVYKMINDIVTYKKNNEFVLNKDSTPFEHFFDINCHRIERNKMNLKHLNEKVYSVSKKRRKSCFLKLIEHEIGHFC